MKSFKEFVNEGRLGSGKNIEQSHDAPRNAKGNSIKKSPFEKKPTLISRIKKDVKDTVGYIKRGFE